LTVMRNCTKMHLTPPPVLSLESVSQPEPIASDSWSAKMEMEDKLTTMT
jgi:hypothetical protein